MKRFRIGQKVWYFCGDLCSIGSIKSGRVKGATKDLATREVTYEIESYGHYPKTLRLTTEYLYPSYKRAFNDHKDELVYDELMQHIKQLERSIEQILNDYSTNNVQNTGYATIALDSVRKPVGIEVKGIGNLQEEVNIVKSEVAKIKNKLEMSKEKSVKDKPNSKERKVK